MHGQFLYLALIRGASQIVTENFTDFSGYEALVNEGRAGLFLGHIVSPQQQQSAMLLL